MGGKITIKCLVSKCYILVFCVAFSTLDRTLHNRFPIRYLFSYPIMNEIMKYQEKLGVHVCACMIKTQTYINVHEYTTNSRLQNILGMRKD